MSAHERRAPKRACRARSAGARSPSASLLFFGTLYYINFRLAFGTHPPARRRAAARAGFQRPVAPGADLGVGVVLSAAARRSAFSRLARVRLAAEAFSYLTLRGIAGEPLKVVLLADSVDAREATAAVALERLAYMVGTTIIVGIGSMLAIAGLPLTRLWFRVFRAFAIAAGVIAVPHRARRGRARHLSAVAAAPRRSTRSARDGRQDASRGSSPPSSGRCSSWCAAIPIRLAVLMTATVAAYACMALEAWVILYARTEPHRSRLNGALAVETFSRVASFASAFIPANLGALEASSLAAVAAVGAVGGGAALALARRLRGLFWAGLGLAIYPRDAAERRRRARDCRRAG